MKHNFNQRRQKRIQSAEQRAKKAAAESDQLYNEAKTMASAIPFGQPILTGHHSEKRDRNFRDRIHGKFGKAFDLQDKAKYYKEKAQTIAGNEAIFSDDPEALDKLRSRLKELQENQQFMKETNACIKKQDRERFLKLPHATAELWEKLTKAGVMGNTGFASFQLRNNNANINRIRQRITTLEKQQSRNPIDQTVHGVRIFENHEANRLQLLFEEKPTAEVRKLLKSHGFRWSPSENAWQRHITGNAFFSAKQIIKGFGKGAES